MLPKGSLRLDLEVRCQWCIEGGGKKADIYAMEGFAHGCRKSAIGTASISYEYQMRLVRLQRAVYLSASMIVRRAKPRKHSTNIDREKLNI